MFEETKLLQASLAGDRDAFESIVEKYQSTICAITFSGTGRLEVSEELAQETFVNAWEHLHQLRDLKGFRFWLYSIARHALCNYHRRKKPVPLDPDLEEITTQDPPEILMRQEEQMMLEQAIMRLPVKYREPLVLFCRQQQSIRQVAAVLELSEATVRTRLHRARKLLREQVAERLEQVLKETGPRKDFTKAVMLAISGVPLGLATTADAAVASGISGQAAVTGGISTILGSVGTKIAVVAAVVAVSALVYTHRSYDSIPTFGSTDTTDIGAASSTAPAQRQVDENSSPSMSDPIPSQGKNDPDGPHPDPKATDAEEVSIEPEPTTPETIVRGTVLDRNTQSPIAGARVGFKPTETVRADSEGHFRLSYKKPHDEAFVYAKAPGYATQRIGLRISPGNPQELLLKLQPGITLVGTVVDPNQDPIANVKVHVHSAFFGYEDTLTDDRGQFRVAGLNPEDAFVYISAEHASYVSNASVTVKLGRLGEDKVTEIVLIPRPPRTVFSGQVTNAQAEPVAQATVGWLHTLAKTRTDHEGRYTLEAPEGKTPVLYVTAAEYPVFVEDVTVPREEAEIRLDVQLDNAQPLSGRIVDDRGDPVPDAVIGIELYQGKTVWGLAGLFHSDAQGCFTIPNAPGQGDCDLLVLGAGIHQTLHKVTPIQDECLIVVSRSGRVYGRVVDADTGGAIGCFRVALGRVGGVPAWWTLDGYTFTSEKGHFDTGPLNLVEGARLALTVYADGYDPLTLDSVPVQAISDDPGRAVFRLQRNTRRSTLYVGRVVDGAGQAIEGAEVGFRLDRDTRDRRGFSRVMTDASGTYMISSVDPREQVLFVRVPGYAPRHCRMSDLLLDATGVFADVILDPPATVSGYAWDELGQPIANTRIVSSFTVRSAEEFESMALFQILWPETQTDEQGYYRLTDLPIGEVHVQVLFDDHRRMAPQRVTVQPGDSLELNFGEQGGFIISGVVVDGRVPLERVEVQLKPIKEGLRSHWGKTDAAGRFKIIEVPAGKYVFATLLPLAAGEPARDPNDISHVLYEVMDIASDLVLTVDYQTRSISKGSPIP
jgi:RNA polymerase sigma factor (sigma-70 family)